jgi:hypothetical protein
MIEEADGAAGFFAGLAAGLVRVGLVGLGMEGLYGIER